MPAKKSQASRPSANSNRNPSLFDTLFWEQVTADDRNMISAPDRQGLLARQARLSARKQGSVVIEFTQIQDKNAGWEGRRTLVDIVTDDMAFLIDSITALLAEKRYLVDLLLHPRLPVTYDAKGIAHLDQQGSAYQSHLHLVLRGHLSPVQQKELRTEIEHVVRDVRFATRDWQAMRLKAIETKAAMTRVPEQAARAEELNEYSEFLDYLYDNNFTFLGARRYRFARQGQKLVSQIVKGSGLGLLSDDLFPAYISDDGAPLSPTLQELRLRRPPLSISKVNRLSTVHRRVPLDAVTVHDYDAEGNVIGETLFIGLFTSVTYSRSLRSIPLLKYKADTVIRASGFEPASHNGRALRHILEKYPRDELFQIDIPTLQKTCLSILRLQERQRIALYCRSDLFRRYVSCLVYVPRDRYETRLRLRFQHILEQELEGTCTNFTSSVDDSPLVRILFTISVKQAAHKKFDPAAIENKLQQAGRLWGDALADALHRNLQEDDVADNLARTYGEAFSADYRERYDLQAAVQDIVKIESVLATKGLQVDVQERGDGTKSLKLYTIDAALVLSDVLPILENMGVQVLTEHPFTVHPAAAAHDVVMQDFTLRVPGNVSFVQLKPVLEESFAGILSGVYENDTLNALTVQAGLPARDVVILRTYVRYLRQAGLAYSLSYLEGAVTAYPALARLFVAYFKTKFDPGLKTRKLDQLTSQINAGLEAVMSLDHDRILRALLTALTVSLRTNFYQTLPGGDPKPYLSVKFDSQAIDYLPNPRPYREIFVYSARMEGIHLRNGRIARGGIRWSDRPEDFRTEVLGLMKAQTVKNAVIVPSGAKGGFIVKHPPKNGDRAAVQAEGIECYRYLVRGLLDITDNYTASGKVTRPPTVVAHDGDDPYLVVAADKGTATFSDIANKLSLEYGFWTGDAFASGGSAGYDHKAMGITARGAWESVKRHFREMNHDTQKSAFDVIGVGDMAGDVFGNGMILSPFVRLVGAFNHIHIFCDPDPEPKASFAERQRLFKNVLGWDQYNTKLLSKGGRIFSRKDKTLELTPEIQKRFDLPKAKVAPSELMAAMLRARTDLMYLGGIGTYVKASMETNAEASDRSNDAHRVNANELRARVVGEGANLGFTQRARIECAERGVRLNADFIDNSAGVDTSDHEVNIKILLAKVAAKSPAKLPRVQRDKLLKSMTDEVAGLVLQDNYQQTQAISLVESQAADLLPAHQKLMQDLEREGRLDRALEFLPDDEMIKQRGGMGKGLTRPEIGILISYTKLRLREELLASDIPDKAELNDWLLGYFPCVLQDKFKAEILVHPLRREIIATVVANILINRLGPTFVHTASARYDAPATAIVRAFVAACQILDLPAIWAGIEQLDNVTPASAQIKALRDVAVLLDRYIGWFLKMEGRKVQINDLVKTYAEPILAYKALMTEQRSLQKIFTPGQMAAWQQKYRGLTDTNIPPNLAALIASRAKLTQAPMVLAAMQASKKKLFDVAAVYIPLGETFGFSWLRTQIDYLPKHDRWSREAAAAMEERLGQTQMKLTVAILRVGKGLEPWLAARTDATADIFALVADLKKTGLNDLTVLMVLIDRIERLV